MRKKVLWKMYDIVLIIVLLLFGIRGFVYHQEQKREKDFREKLESANITSIGGYYDSQGNYIINP
jgi:hypothetical protein